MRRKASLLLTLVALVTAMPLLAACNTTAGAGQDLSNAGQDLRNSAERNK